MDVEENTTAKKIIVREQSPNFDVLLWPAIAVTGCALFYFELPGYLYTLAIPGSFIWICFVIFAVYKRTENDYNRPVTWRNFGWLPLVATALCLAECYVPGNSYAGPFWVFGFLLWITIIFSGFVRIIISAFKAPGKSIFPKNPAPAIILFIITMIGLTPAPTALAVMLSQAALLDFVHTKADPAKRRIKIPSNDVKQIAQLGAFPIYDYFCNGDEIYLITYDFNEGSVPTCEGLLYSKSDPTKERKGKKHNSEIHVKTHLFGDWWEFSKDENFPYIRY